MIAWGAIRALLSRVPMLAWTLMAALAWGAWQRHQVGVEHAKTLKAQQALAALQLAAAQTTVTTLSRAIAGQQDAIHDAHTQTQAADTARVAVTGALGRLLERNSAAGRSRAAAPAAAGSAPACATAPVQPDVLRGLGEAAGQLAAYADRSRIAGATCEASYDSAVKAAKP